MKSTLRHTFEIGEDAFWREIFFDHGFVQRMYREALGCASIAFLEDSGDTAEGRTRRFTFTQKLDAPRAPSGSSSERRRRWRSAGASILGRSAGVSR